MSEGKLCDTKVTLKSSLKRKTPNLSPPKNTPTNEVFWGEGGDKGDHGGGNEQVGGGEGGRGGGGGGGRGGGGRRPGAAAKGVEMVIIIC